MSEARFQVNANYSEKEIIDRVAIIINGTNFSPIYRDNKWQLDGGNNWWLNTDLPGEYILRFRYDNAVAISGLCYYLEWLFS